MVKRRFVPDRGDIVWLNFDPQTGKEQAGHRPALVLSPKTYNKLVGLAIVCPITSQVKGYPFEVEVRGKKILGCVIADHVKNIDWVKRNASFIEVAADEVIDDVSAKLAALLWS
jgi:mRNA interferase MazF